MPSAAALLLWAGGRAGTESIFRSLERSVQLRPCYGEKEGFKQHTLSRASLYECAVRTCINVRQGCIVGTHVKPFHLALPSSSLESAEVFMAAAAAAGWKLVVVVDRYNLLARTVSSYELLHGGGRDPGFVHAWRTFGNLHLDNGRRDPWVRDAACLQRGATAAKARNMVVIWLSFLPMVRDTCHAVWTIARSLVALGHSFLRQQMRCNVATGHTQTSHRSATLSQRIGASAARAVESQLRGGVYEWMLDLSREEPPASYMHHWRSAVTNYSRTSVNPCSGSGSAVPSSTTITPARAPTSRIVRTLASSSAGAEVLLRTNATPQRKMVVAPPSPRRSE